MDSDARLHAIGGKKGLNPDLPLPPLAKQRRYPYLRFTRYLTLSNPTLKGLVLPTRPPLALIMTSF